jgi:hypothetical protein
MGSIADWDDEYAKLARAASQLRTAGAQLGGSRESQAATVSKGLGGLQARLTQFDMSGVLTPAELARRRKLVNSLQQQVQSDAGGTGGGSQNNYGSGPQQPQFQNATSMALRQQDDMIDELAVGVGRLKSTTHLINDEARQHVKLLDDMDGDIEKAQLGLLAETERAQKLKEDNSVWRLYGIIVGLSVLLLLLVLAGLS